MRLVWWVVGVLLVVAEIGLHFGDFHIPLEGDYALITTPEHPSICALTYRRESIVDTVAAYEQPAPDTVLVQIDDEHYAVVQDGSVKQLDSREAWAPAVAQTVLHYQPDLRRPSRLDDPDYRVFQVVLLIAVVSWVGVGLVGRYLRTGAARALALQEGPGT